MLQLSDMVSIRAAAEHQPIADLIGDARLPVYYFLPGAYCARTIGEVMAVGSPNLFGSATPRPNWVARCLTRAQREAVQLRGQFTVQAVAQFGSMRLPPVVITLDSLYIRRPKRSATPEERESGARLRYPLEPLRALAAEALEDGQESLDDVIAWMERRNREPGVTMVPVPGRSWCHQAFGDLIAAAKSRRRRRR